MESIIFKIFFITANITKLLQTFLESLHSSVFMGLLNSKRFEESRSYPLEANQAYLEANLNSGPELWVGQWISELPENGKVLVIGAGGGSEAVALSEAGHDVIGIEYDEALADAIGPLLESHDRISIEALPFLQLPEDMPEVDAVLFAHHYLSHIPNREDRLQILKAIAKETKPGAPIGFAYYHRELNFVRRTLIECQAPFSNLLRFIFHPFAKPRVRIEKGNHLDPNVPMLHHHFIESEVTEEMNECGISILETGRDWNGWATGCFEKPSDIEGDQSSISQNESLVSTH